MTSKELQQRRERIDEIDRQIVSLLEKRLSLVASLKPYKICLEDLQREKEILSHIESPYIREIYGAIFAASKQLLRTR